MSLWHADVNQPGLVAGASITVYSPHQMVRVITSDQMSIETPGGGRLGAQVLDRTGASLKLILSNGNVAELSIAEDRSIPDHWQPGEMFSQQRWIVN